jgi:secondary thiamine-phosphate synthase enzyme
MTWIQHSLRLAPRRRGFHLITDEVEAALADLSRVRVGLLHVFLQHTSASLCLNENADPDVPRDLELAFHEIAREDFPYTHTAEGPDDMPAHVKTAMIGVALTIPIAAGRLCLGTWQGIYLCEHRERAGSRKLVLTLQGDLG